MAATVLLAAGCANLPDTSVEAADTGAWQASLRDAVDAAEIGIWWSRIDDAQLQVVLERGIGANLELPSAIARLHEARRHRLTEMNKAPTILTADDFSLGQPLPRGPTLHSPGLDSAWELALFETSARNPADLALRDVLVSLAAEIALNYVDARTAEVRLGFTQLALAANLATFATVTSSAPQHPVTSQNVGEALRRLERERAQVEALNGNVTQAQHRLALLLGVTQDGLDTVFARAAGIPRAPDDIAVGVPAEMLRRRPDVRRAERQLAAVLHEDDWLDSENASFALPGSIGLESLDPARLFDWSDKTAAGRPMWMLFDPAQVRGGLQSLRARQQRTLIDYESTLLGALADVESALSLYEEHVRQRPSLLAAVEAQSARLRSARSGYEASVIAYDELMQSTDALLVAQDAQAVNEADTMRDVIRLYKAMSGGWRPLRLSPANLR